MASAGEELLDVSFWLCGWFFSGGTCEVSGNTEPVFHSGVLSLILLIGYLGLDRIGETPNNLRLKKVINDGLGNKVDVARLHFKNLQSFEYHDNVGANTMPGVYFLRLRLQMAQSSEAPSRLSFFYPPPFSTYWFVCRIEKDQKDWPPYLLATLCFLKFFLISAVGLQHEIPTSVLIICLLIDFFSICWVVQRVWRVSNIGNVVKKIVNCWDKWHNTQMTKQVDESQKQVAS